MDCSRISGMLSDYIDGALGPADRKAVEEHLESCQRCSSELGDLRKTIAGLGGLDDVTPPAWLTQKVMARIRDERPRRPLLQRLFAPVNIKVPLGAAAMIAISVVTLYLFRSMQHEVAPEKAPGPESRTVVPETRDKTEAPSAVPAGPIAKRETPLPSAPREAVPSRPRAADAPAPGIPAAPIQQPPAPDHAAQEKQSPVPGAGFARRDSASVKEQKAPNAEGSRTASPGRMMQAERASGGQATAANAAARKNAGKVIWSDEAITGADTAKVTKVVLVDEKKGELVLDVSYYLSADFGGHAAVGIYPDIPGWPVSEVRAAVGKHTVGISVSRGPSAKPEDSTSLRIEITGYRDDALIGPLYRRIVPFKKRWEDR